MNPNRVSHQRRGKISSEAITRLLLAGLFLIAVPGARAATAGEAGVNGGVWEQVVRFVTLQDAGVAWAVLGCALLGITCGMIGSFVVVRKLALAGDAISHAILPGIAAGYLWTYSKNPVALFVGAVLAGLLGSVTVGLITRTTRIKQDAALGIVLAGFFAVGLVMIDRIGHMPVSGKSGLKSIFFGSIAGLNWQAVVVIAVVSIGIALTLFLFYKQFLAAAFDAQFARSIGIPERLVHHGLMLMLAFAVVVAVQAVGVVLVSAMLIIPPSTAYLLADRMHRVIFISCGVGLVSAVAGAFFSFLDIRFPTGAFVVLTGGFCFTLAFFFAPRHGLLKRWLYHRRRRTRTARENTLKAMYHVWEEHGQEEGNSGEVSLSELARRRRVSDGEIRAEVADLARGNWARLAPNNDAVAFSDRGWERACEIVRNHRLWELYLTHAADIAPDHVHDDAERIEHILGADVVKELERKLDFAEEDPHGKKIPGRREIEAGVPG